MTTLVFNMSHSLNTKSEKTFDMFRLSQGKAAVDVCPNTLRAYNADGLPFYRMGKAVFISKTELEGFIRSKAAK